MSDRTSLEYELFKGILESQLAIEGNLHLKQGVMDRMIDELIADEYMWDKIWQSVDKTIEKYKEEEKK